MCRNRSVAKGRKKERKKNIRHTLTICSLQSLYGVHSRLTRRRKKNERRERERAREKERKREREKKRKGEQDGATLTNHQSDIRYAHATCWQRRRSSSFVIVNSRTIAVIIAMFDFESDLWVSDNDRHEEAWDQIVKNEMTNFRCH